MTIGPHHHKVHVVALLVLVQSRLHLTFKRGRFHVMPGLFELPSRLIKPLMVIANRHQMTIQPLKQRTVSQHCLLYTSDAADE